MDTLLTPRFHVIGTQANAWRTLSGGTFSTIKSGSSVANATVTSSSDTGAFGSSMIQKTSGYTTIRALCYPGRSNWSDNGSFSVLMRIIPRWTGAPSSGEQALFNAQFSATVIQGIYAVMGVDGGFYLGYYDQYGTAMINPNSEGTGLYTGFVAGTAVDLLAVYNGGNHLYWYADGTLVSTMTLAVTSPSVNNQNIGNLVFGTCPTGGTLSTYDVNELAVWNYALSSTDISNLTARTTFLATSAFDATYYTDAGISNIASGVNYYFQGVEQTGTATTSTDPGVANVVSGVGYNINGTALTGTAVPTVSIGSGNTIVVGIS